MFSFIPVPALAATTEPVTDDNIFKRTCTDFGINSAKCPEYESSAKLEKTVGAVIRYALIAIGLLAVIFIIWGGFRITMSGGNVETVKEGRRVITFALIGLVAATLAGILVALIFSAVDDIFL
jgi:hypothetical protein